MFDPLIRTEPVPTAPFVASGVTISYAPAMARYSLRARQAQALETLLKLKAPHTIGTTKGCITCLGPDEWLMRGPVDTVIPSGEGLAIAVTDVSDRAVCFTVKGPRAAEVLMSGCPLDLDLFATGRASRTLYETVEIILIREGEDCFHVEVWRSFSPWLWKAITVAASH